MRGFFNFMTAKPGEIGQPFAYDPDFKGPAKSRLVTNLNFAVLFGVFFAGWVLLGIWASSTTENPHEFYDQVKQDIRYTQHSDNPIDILSKHRMTVITGLVLVILAAILIVFLMRWFAAPLLWMNIALLHSVLLSSAYICLEESVKNSSVGMFRAGAILSFIFTVSALITFSMRKRIMFAIALINEVSRAVRTMSSTVFFPIVPALMQIGVIFFGMSLAINLSLKSITSDGEPSSFGFLHTYNIVATFWTVSFISSLAEMILAGTFGTWYWTYNKNDIPSNALGMAAFTSVCYHFGTIALGSLIITFCRILRFLLGIRDNNSIGCGPCMCIRWCLCCVEKFLKRFNRNVYIMCAMHGTPFCTSAMDAHNLILRNVLRCIASDWVTRVVFWLSKMMFGIGAGVITLVCLVSYGKGLNPDDRDAAYKVAVILSASAYTIAGIFFTVYSMAVDTLVLCFLEDCERNDGSAGRPYYMSHRLMKLLASESSPETYHPLTDETTIRFNEY